MYVAFVLIVIQFLLKSHTIFHSVILCADYNISHFNWSSDELGHTSSGDFIPVSHTIVDSFLFHNFFRLNSPFKSQANTLGIILLSSNKNSVSLATESLVISDLFPLHIKFCSQSINFYYSNTHTYKNFKVADYSVILRVWRNRQWIFETLLK